MMKRISKLRKITSFSRTAISDRQGVPMPEGVKQEEAQQDWGRLCDHLEKYCKYTPNDTDLFDLEAAIPETPGGEIIQFLIRGQFEYDDGYVLLVDCLTLMSAKQKFRGLCVWQESVLVILDCRKDFSEFTYFRPMQYIWWWQRRGEAVSSQVIPGIENIHLNRRGHIEFDWPVRGRMRLKVLKKPRFGFQYGIGSNLFGWVFFSTRVSRLRLRKRYFAKWPTTRSFWGVLYRIYDFIFMSVGFGG